MSLPCPALRPPFAQCDCRLAPRSELGLQLLTILVEAYEREHDDEFKAASPQEMVEFMAEQKGIGRTALAELMGGRSRLSDFLNENRKLSINQITKLREALGIPADLLIGR